MGIPLSQDQHVITMRLLFQVSEEAFISCDVDTVIRYIEDKNKRMLLQDGFIYYNKLSYKLYNRYLEQFDPRALFIVSAAPRENAIH